MRTPASGGFVDVPSTPASSLTPRQLEVLRAYALTPLYRAVAIDLGVNERTVRQTLHNAYERLGTGTAIDSFRVLGWLVPA